MDDKAILAKPRYFFKYRSITGDPDDEESPAYRTRDIIEKSRLYWPSPLSFNDPFDCLPANEVGGSKLKRELKHRKDLKKLDPHLRKGQVKKIARRARSIPKDFKIRAIEGSNRLWLEKIGICSLSATASNVLMWSHYSDSHTGICLQFEPSRHWATALEAENLYFEEALPVRYADKRPIFDLSKPADEQDVLNTQFLTKADYWSYEQEWRLIRHKVPPGYQAFPSKCLNSIILGAMVSEADEAHVRQWNDKREKPARIKRALLGKMTYEIEIVDAD